MECGSRCADHLRSPSRPYACEPVSYSIRWRAPSFSSRCEPRPSQKTGDLPLTFPSATIGLLPAIPALPLRVVHFGRSTCHAISSQEISQPGVRYLRPAILLRHLSSRNSPQVNSPEGIGVICSSRGNCLDAVRTPSVQWRAGALRGRAM